MKIYKNYLIAVLAGLLVLSLTIQPSQGATTVKLEPAKVIQYENCLSLMSEEMLPTTNWLAVFDDYLENVIRNCAQNKPANLAESKPVLYKFCFERVKTMLINFQVLPRNNDVEKKLTPIGVLNFASYQASKCTKYRP